MWCGLFYGFVYCLLLIVLVMLMFLYGVGSSMMDDIMAFLFFLFFWVGFWG